MRDSYNRGGGFGGRSSFGGNRGGGFGGRRDSFDKPEMHDAVCDNCGKDCQVPFKPSGDKPIYCSKCFENVDPRRDERNSREDRFPRKDDFPRRDERPRFRDNEKPRSSNGAELSQFKDQLGSISAKLDKLIRILTPVVVEVEEKKSSFDPKPKVTTIQDYKEETVVVKEKKTAKAKAKAPAKKKTTKKA